MNTPRKWIILSGSCGVACGLILATIYAIRTYERRPRSWNATAIVAIFDKTQAVIGEDRLVISYVLHNKTRTDYKLSTADQVEFGTRLKNGPILVHDDLAIGEANPLNSAHPIKLGTLPVFIPAGESVPFSVSCFSPFPKDFTQPAGADAIGVPSEAGGTEAVALRDIAGFVLFDKATRYQIELRKGW